MNKKISYALTFAIAFALMASPIFAQNVQSVSTSSSASSATTGTNIVVTSVSTSDTGDVSNSQVTLTKSSGPGDFSISDPSTGSYSGVTVTTSGVSKPFTLTAGTAGTYLYKVTSTWSSGSKSSTEATLEFIEPSALTTTASPTSATKSQGDSFSLSISVQNPQSSDVLTSYSLTAPSQFTVSGDPTSNSGTTITSTTTRTFSWTLTLATCYTGSKDITFALGSNTAASTITITSGNSSCTTSTTNTTTTSTTTSSGGGGTTTKTVAKILANQSSTLVFDAASISDITLTAKNTINNAAISVKEGAKPTSAPDPAAETDTLVYKYVELSIANFSNSDVKNASINFKIESGWFSSNNIDSNSVQMWRYFNSEWQKLETTKTLSTSSYIYYTAVTPGFSTFVIVGRNNAASDQPLVQPLVDDTSQANNQTGGLTVASFDAATIIVAIIVIGIIGAAYYFYKNSSKDTEERRIKRLKKKFD
ncbi:MAG TPA: PGF-pre-PGF domain-containing protein [archaeon]|nr:PGF-pre-PGF domain-containing protein [archaeon]